MIEIADYSEPDQPRIRNFVPHTRVGCSPLAPGAADHSVFSTDAVSIGCDLRRFGEQAQTICRTVGSEDKKLLAILGVGHHALTLRGVNKYLQAVRE